MSEDCTVSLKAMRDRLVQELDCIRSPSLATVYRNLNLFNISLKRVTKRAVRGDTPDIQQQRREYSAWFIGVSLQHRNLLFLDETGFQVSSRASRGRSTVNTPAFQRRLTLRSQNISVMATMNRNG